MNILLLGPQGSGKGTQARLLSEKSGFFYFEMGKFLREIAEKNEKVKEMLDDGIMVPDKEATSYATSYLDEKGIYDGILFDGFPRNTTQWDFIKGWFEDKKVKLNLVIVLDIPREVSIQRLSSRRIDSDTGKIYNLVTDPPPENIDKDKLIQRDDDKPEAIKKRLDTYEEKTKTLIEKMKNETKVIIVDGTRSIDEIHKYLVKEIEKTQSGQN